ncbi:hypothetical protein JTE90_011124 [Oedothorax gibbosus]|uniref:Uncharacterized protein n=1 Tax=Oedothorax gibbosus TaxID=931172 RepID=A0AAV6TE53_9ARAC|nr:hypothetical protein JTE90_011124 [Oedothorax gibbosus]
MRSETDTDRIRRVISHIDRVEYHATECRIHARKACFLIVNNDNESRFHCLCTNHSTVWKSIPSSHHSCDLPEHFYEMIEMEKWLGSEYVLPFWQCFRERSGYTVGMFYQPVELYAPRIIERAALKETAYALIVFFCAVCYQLGGHVPDMKRFLFLYTSRHPVLCDMGSYNVEKRERLVHHEPHLNVKKWHRVMQKKTIRDVLRYLKLEFQLYFKQKKKRGQRCILDETNECFDTETHQLLCQSQQKSLVQVLKEFQHLMPQRVIRQETIGEWISSLTLDDPC